MAKKRPHSKVGRRQGKTSSHRSTASGGRPAKTPKTPWFQHVRLERITVYATAFVLFVIPLFIWPGITEYGYGKTMVLLVAVSLLSVLWGLSGWRRGPWTVRIPWIILPVLGFVLAALLSLIGAMNGRVVIQSLVLVVFFAQLALIIANIAREKRDVAILLGAITLAAFLASLYALLQYLGVVAGAPGARGLNRIISTLGNRNFLGGFLGYLLLPSFVLVLRPRLKTVRCLAILTIAFNFGTLMLVQQLAPMIGLGVAVVVLLVGLMIFRPVEPIRKNRGWLIALLALLAFTYLIEAPSSPLNSVIGFSQDSTSWIGRMWVSNSGRTRALDWWIGLEMFKEHPITGVGLGNYKLNFLGAKARFLASPQGAAYRDLYIPRAAQAHNEYVQVGAEVGVLGLLAMVGFLVVGAASLWVRLRRTDSEENRLDLLLFTAGLAVFLVHALVSFPAHLPVSSLMLVVLVGLIFSPTYGDAAVRAVRMSRRAAGIALALMGLFGSVVSGFALADLSANIAMGRGIEKFQLGETREAKALLERSLSLDFAPRQTYYYLGSTQVRLGDLEGALSTYEKCFTRFVDENLYAIYADVALKLGETQKAQEAVEFLLATNPPSPLREQARYQQANIAITMREYARAQRLLEDLVDLAPEYEPAWIGLGNLFQGLGLDSQALETYERAMTLIEKKLARVERKIARTTRGTAQEFNELMQSQTVLRQERDFVQEQLDALHGE